MRPLLSALLTLLTVSACAPAPLTPIPNSATRVSQPASRVFGRLITRDIPALDLAAALTRFTQFEQRKVSANHVTTSGGHAGATLTVPLGAQERAVLLQLYRLTPQQSDATQWPVGLLDRSADQLAVLHHFQLPHDAPTDATGIKALLKARQYMDGNNKVQAFEAFVRISNSYQILGKYDLQGRMLQVDMDTWPAVP